jgi:hypothetical protein
MRCSPRERVVPRPWHRRRHFLAHAGGASQRQPARLRRSRTAGGHDCNTTVHVAEHLAGVRYRLPKYATVMEHGRPRRYDYGETDHCCERFAQLDDWLRARQRRGTMGRAPARLACSRDIVDAALEHLLEDETVFLHPPAATCGECDPARKSIS